MRRMKLLTADVARILDVTPARVRDLARRGTLPAERTDSGVRLFDSDHVKQLALERECARSAGLLPTRRRR